MKKFLISLFILLQVLFIPIPLNNTIFAENQVLSDFSSNNYSNFTILSQTEFYCVDNQTNQVVHYKNGDTTSFGKYGEASGEFAQIKKLLILKNGEIVVFDNLNKLHFFDSNSNYISTITSTKIDNSLTPLGQVYDIQSDIYSNVYLLDSTNNYILKASSDSKNFSVVSSTTLNSNTKFTILNNSQNFVILDNCELKSGENQISLEIAPKSLFSDAKNYIYLVYNEKIEKYNQNLTLINNQENSIGENYSINLENGEIYYFQDAEIKTLKDFASNLEDYTPPVDVKDKTPLSENIVILTPTRQVNLLTNPYSSKTLKVLNTQDKLILLAKTQDFETQFCYVMYQNANETFIGFVEERYLTPLELPSKNEEIIPVRNDVPYYKYPNAQIDYKISNFTQSTLSMLNEFELDGVMYYQIKLNDFIIFAKSDDFINSDISLVNVYLITNAQIAPYNNENVILYLDENKTEILLTINTPQNVKLLEKQSNGLSKIQVLYSNKIVTCYVETKFIVPNNDLSLPLTIVLSVICLITITVLLIKLKKDKSKKINY